MHKVFHSPAQLYSGVQHRRHDAIAAPHMPFREYGVTASAMLPAWYQIIGYLIIYSKVPEYTSCSSQQVCCDEQFIK